MRFSKTVLFSFILCVLSCTTPLQTLDQLYSYTLLRDENNTEELKFGYKNYKYDSDLLEKARILNCDELKVLYHELDSIRKTYPRKAFKIESKHDSIQTLQWAVDLETRYKQCNKNKKFKLYKKPKS